MPQNECKRILAIHDLSGFGHTSLMAFIPIMYRLGIRVCALPTAVLSANTDYPGQRWVDMSEHLEAFAGHWRELGLDFSAICSGFLSSAEQAGMVKDIISSLKREKSPVLVDPVMGDNGSLYSCFDERIVPAMRGLVSVADIVTPNFTEAAMLAGISTESDPGELAMLEICRGISALGPRQVVVTSVPGTSNEELAVCHYDSSRDELASYPFQGAPGHHPGAGDCFSAFLLAGQVMGYSLAASVRAAVEIMTLAIGEPLPEGADWREGVALERVLAWDLDKYYKELE
jgi:pyridoxine kinase